MLCVASAVGQANDAGVAQSQKILERYSKDRNLVAFAAVPANLRSDVSCRTKPGKHVEAVLQNDVRFNDGTELRKGTVLDGVVTASSEGTKDDPKSTLVVDWTSAQLPKKQTMPLAAMVRDAQGSLDPGGADHAYGRNQLGATSSSGASSDKLATGMNLILLNKNSGMPQIAPGVNLVPTANHSMAASGAKGALVLREGTQLVLVLFKDRAPAAGMQ
jgi:hypothetical protein